MLRSHQRPLCVSQIRGLAPASQDYLRVALRGPQATSQHHHTEIQTQSLISTSQLPVDRWYELVGNPTLADAILDRIVQDAYRVELSGESLRKPRASA